MTRKEVAVLLGPSELTDNPEIPLDIPEPDGEPLMELQVFDASRELHQPAVEYRGGQVVSVEVFSNHDALRTGEIYIFRNTPLFRG